MTDSSLFIILYLLIFYLYLSIILLDLCCIQYFYYTCVTSMCLVCVSMSVTQINLKDKFSVLIMNQSAYSYETNFNKCLRHNTFILNDNKYLFTDSLWVLKFIYIFSSFIFISSFISLFFDDDSGAGCCNEISASLISKVITELWVSHHMTKSHWCDLLYKFWLVNRSMRIKNNANEMLYKLYEVCMSSYSLRKALGNAHLVVWDNVHCCCNYWQSP